MKGLPRSLKHAFGSETGNVGSIPSVSGLTVQEFGGPVRKTVLQFDSVSLALTDVAGIVAYAGLKIYDMPAGAILFLGAMADLDLTVDAAGVNADWDGDFSLGTVTASNNATLSSTEANLIASTATPQASSSATTANGLSTSTEVAKVFDGSSTAMDVFLNFLVDDADQDVTTTPTNLVISGTIVLHWINLGDI